MTDDHADCVFCNIVAGRAPAHQVAENELSLCLLDINPFSEGHCLVIPKRHVPWWHELTPAETASLFELARVAADKIMAAYQPEFVCLYARGRRIPHTHLFLVPTKSGDVLDRFFNALENFQESPPRLTEMRTPAALAAAAKKLNQE
jgi:histidine triad (HIT) family protein